MNPPTVRPSGFAAVLIALGLGVVTLSLLHSYLLFLLPLDTAREVRPWLGVLDNLLTACALLGLYLWTRSPIWLAAALAVGAVALIGAGYWTTHSVTAGGMDLMAYVNITAAEAAFILMGVALLVRRTDGPAGSTVGAGIAVLSVAVITVFLWTAIILRYELNLGGRHSNLPLVAHLSSFFHHGGVAATNALLIGFFVGVLGRRLETSIVKVRRLGAAALLRVGAAGALLLGVAWSGIHGELIDLLSRTYVAPTLPTVMLAFMGLLFVGSMMFGAGFLGLSWVNRGPLGLIAAIGVWVQPVAALILVFVVGRSTEPLLLGLAAVCQLLGALAFLVCSRSADQAAGPGQGRFLGLLAAVLLSLSAAVNVLAAMGLLGRLPSPAMQGVEGSLVAKVLVSVICLLFVGAYLTAALYQLHLADRVHFAPDNNALP